MDHQKISRAAVYQLILICSLLIPSRAGAQASDQSPTRPQQDESLQLPRSSDPGRQPFIRAFLQDEVHMWSSPFRRSSYSTRTFSRYVLPFTLITSALIATDHQTSDLLPNSPDQSKWSLRVSQIGAPYTLAGISAGMYLISKATGNRKARETGFLGAAAIGHSQLLTLGLKYVTQRKRPIDYKAEGSVERHFGEAETLFPRDTRPAPLRLRLSLRTSMGKITSGCHTRRMDSPRLSQRPASADRNTGRQIYSSAGLWGSLWADTYTRTITILELTEVVALLPSASFRRSASAALRFP